MVDIAVSGGVGSIVLVVPRGWGANTDRVDRWMGRVSNRIDAIAGPGSPTLLLHGSSAVGSIVVRHPNWFDRVRLRRALSPTRAGGSSSPQDASPQDAPPER